MPLAFHECMGGMEQQLNAFNQYDHLENRLTQALGVTLERSKAFRSDFIKRFAPAARLNKNLRVKLQLAKGRSTVKDEVTGIPDLAIIDDNNRAIIIESKVAAGLKASQLVGHENKSRHNELNVRAALAITGRDEDRDKIAGWIKGRRLKLSWHHVTWRQVYHLAASLAVKKDTWARELQEYMNIVAHQLDEKKDMDQNVKIADFTGIPFKSYEDFTPQKAKRLLRSLIDSLGEDRKFLARLGFKKGQRPRTRKGISKGLGIWDYLSPVGQDMSHKKAHHFTISVSQEKLTTMLTIPNGPTFRRFRNHLKKDESLEFEHLVSQFLKSLKRGGILKSGGQPRICIVQRRYKGRRSLFAVDGEMNFDLRTIKGQARMEKLPAIKVQPEWLDLCKRLILKRKGNVQFQIGVWFPYDHCPAINTPKATDLVKGTIVRLMPIVDALRG